MDMFKKRLLSYVMIPALFMVTVPVLAEDKAQPESFATYITNKYLNSNFVTEVKQTTTDTSTQGNTSFMKEFNKQLDSQREILTEREAQEAAFSMATASFINPTTLIDKSVTEKLELIGGGENKNQHLFGKLFGNKLHTTLGKAYTAFTFCNPISDVQTLHNRQQAITLLSAQKDSIQKLNFAFKAIENDETKSLTYWHLKPILQERLMGFLYFNLGPLKKLNTNTCALEITSKGGDLFSIASAATQPLLTYGPDIYNTAKQNNLNYWQATKKYCHDLKFLLTSPNIPPKMQKNIRIGFGINLGSVLIVQPFLAYLIARQLQYKIEGTSHIHSILIATADHVNQLKKLSTFVNKNKQLVQLLPNLKPLADFNNPNKHSDDLNRLLGMLDTDTFKGEPSFWSLTGRVLAAHKLMGQVKDELAPVFAAAGELEMYVALAQMYAEQQGENATWCMANFVESDTPVIEAQSFWNPFINPDVVVTNDVVFNSEYPNSILTGPNTGGKSTVIKAVMFNVLMAQTFGIAPAQSLTLTPFAKLNCFMNIADDIATGASLFKSEVMRAKELSAMISSLKADEFSFVIIDEVFTGTSPVEGEMAALRFAQHLTTFPNSIAVIATHYPKMTTLEEETNGKFYNHHVEILRNEDGSLNRTFKLKNGPTFVNVAFDILEEEGLVI